MNITFIVGNGLDLSLGLKTKYSDFYGYAKENELANNQIYDAIKKDPKTWANFEHALGEHTQIVELPTEEERDIASEKLHKAFDQVLGDLGDYLKLQVKISTPKMPTYAMRASDFYRGLLGDSSRKVNALLNGAQINASFVTLNYTNSLENLMLPVRNQIERHGINIMQMHHAHGTLSEYITMGVSNDSQLSAALQGDSKDDLIKPRLLESMGDDRLLTTRQTIANSGMIVIYGTSLGATDEYIWQQVISWLAKSENRYVILHDFNSEQKKRPTLNPSRIKQLDNEAKNRLLDHSQELSDEDRVKLRSKILVVRNTSFLFVP